MPGTPTLVAEPRIEAISFRSVAGKPCLIARFADETTTTLPLAQFPALAAVQPAQRDNWRLISCGAGVHWPDLDLDLSAAGLRAGLPDMTASARSRLSPRHALIAVLASRSTPLSAQEVATALAKTLKKETIQSAIAKLKTKGVLIASKPATARRTTPRRRSVA